MTDRSRPPPGPDRRNRTAERDRQVAIALSHDIGSDHAPTVVAKGYGEVAERILRLAFDNDVKVRADPDLAQILEVVEVDCEIPVQAFAAVAEILTYVRSEEHTSELQTLMAISYAVFCLTKKKKK